MQSHNNHLGTKAEIRFVTEALERGLLISLPFGLNIYDFVVDGPNGLKRVQVKSTSAKDSHSRGIKYKVMLTRGAKVRKYQKGEIDIFAIYVEPEKAWYILPFDLVEGKYCISLFTSVEESSSKYETFRDRWDLF